MRDASVKPISHTTEIQTTTSREELCNFSRLFAFTRWRQQLGLIVLEPTRYCHRYAIDNYTSSLPWLLRKPHQLFRADGVLKGFGGIGGWGVRFSPEAP
jgi:hypothetical protein